MKNNSIFFYVKDQNNKILSIELILFSANYAHSYLGTTTMEGKRNYANQFLKYKIIEYLKNKNIKYYLLGGGQSPEDGIYKYKESLAPNSYVNSKIYFNIWNKKVYKDLNQYFKKKITSKKLQFYEK